MKYIALATDWNFFFIFHIFLLRIPSNINQTAVGLFWLSNNN